MRPLLDALPDMIPAIFRWVPFGFGVALILVLLLAALVLVFGILTVVQAHQAGREGWWVYLIALFVSPLNIVAIILWFGFWKKNPLMVNGRPFM